MLINVFVINVFDSKKFQQFSKDSYEWRRFQRICWCNCKFYNELFGKHSWKVSDSQVYFIHLKLKRTLWKKQASVKQCEARFVDQKFAKWCTQCTWAMKRCFWGYWACHIARNNSLAKSKISWVLPTGHSFPSIVANILCDGIGSLGINWVKKFLEKIKLSQIKSPNSFMINLGCESCLYWTWNSCCELVGQNDWFTAWVFIFERTPRWWLHTNIRQWINVYGRSQCQVEKISYDEINRAAQALWWWQNNLQFCRLLLMFVYKIWLNVLI